ncbi:MAG: hypothetical protein AAGF32_04955, partial [Pseudomonadota bacterium]
MRVNARSTDCSSVAGSPDGEVCAAASAGPVAAHTLAEAHRPANAHERAAAHKLAIPAASAPTGLGN